MRFVSGFVGVIVALFVFYQFIFPRMGTQGVVPAVQVAQQPETVPVVGLVEPQITSGQQPQEAPPAVRTEDEQPQDTPPAVRSDCRAVDRGTLEENSSFTVSNYAQVNYWTEGEAERDVIVPPGSYSRPEGYGGRIWEWVGCTEEQATEGALASWPVRENDGVNVGGWGDVSFLTSVDSGG